MKERWRPGRWHLLLAGLLVAVAVIALLRTRTVAEGACAALRSHLPSLTGLEVGIGGCSLDPLTQEVVLRDVAFRQPESDAPLFAVDSARVRMGPMRVLSGRLNLELVRLEHPRMSLDLRDPVKRAPEASAPACPLDLFERLEIGQLEIQNAELALQLPGDVEAELGGIEIGWNTVRRGTEIELEATRGALTLASATAPLALHQVVAQATLDLNAGALEIARAEIGLDEALLSLSGRIQSLCAPQAELEAQLYLPLTSVARALGTDLPMSGHAWSRWSINGPLESADIRGDLTTHALRIGHFTPGELTADLRLGGDRLHVERLRSTTEEGHFEVTAELGLLPTLPVRASVELDRVAFGHVMRRAGVPNSWVDFRASGIGALQGDLFPRPQLRGTMNLTTQDFVLASRAWDAPAWSGRDILRFRQGTASGQVQILGDRAVLTGFQITSGGTQLKGDATLHYAASRGLDIRGRAERVDLRDFGHISGLFWEGQGSGTFEIVGPYDKVKIESGLAMRDFRFDDFAAGVVESRVLFADNVLRFPGVSGQKGRTLFHGDAAIDFNGETSVNAQLSVPSGRVQDVIEIVAPLHRGVAAFRNRLVGQAEGGLWFEGPLDTFAGEVRLKLRDLTLLDRRLGHGELRLRFEDGDRMILEPMVLHGPLGQTRAQGTWSFDSGKLDYRLRGERWQLGELMGSSNGQDGVSADLTFSATVSGSRHLPLMTAWLQSPDVRFAQRSLGPMLLEARMVDDDLQVFGRPFRDTHGTMNVDLNGDWPFEANLTLSLPEIRPLLPDTTLTRGMSGRLSGVLTARGDLLEYEDARVEARVDGLKLRKGEWEVASTSALALTWDAGTLTVPPFSLRGAGSEIRGEGVLAPDFVDARLQTVAQAQLLESFVPRLERAKGRVELTAMARGRRDRPTVHGTIDWTGGAGRLRGLPVAFDGLDARVDFNEERLNLSTFSGGLNGGRMTASGTITLADFAPQQVELATELENVSLRLSQDIQFRSDGRLSLTGPAQLPRLGGVIDISGLRYTRGLELEELLSNVGRARGAVIERAVPEEFVQLGVEVRLSDVQVDNSLARAAFGGELMLTGTNARPALVGTVQLKEGGEAFFRGHRFDLTAGQLEFTERSNFDPFVDLRAQTSVRHSVGGEEERYAVSLHAQGRARDPEVSLSSAPSLAEGDIVSLLTLGFTSRDRSETASAGIGLLSEAFLSVTGLDRQVQRLLPTGLLLKDADVQVSTQYNPSSGTSEPTVQLESRFLTEELSLQIAQPIVSRKGTRAQAEYRFSDSVSAQAQWMDQSSAGATVGNPGLELKWSWEVE